VSGKRQSGIRREGEREREREKGKTRDRNGDGEGVRNVEEDRGREDEREIRRKR